jgi:RNA polymerase sigma factor (TIGR02999 family)
MQAPLSQTNETKTAPPAVSALDLTGSLYGELYEVADKLMRRERLDCSLQSTMLVHDAFMVLRRQRNLPVTNRPVLLAASAKIMRRLLVDHARARVRLKRGGKNHKESLPSALPDDANSIDVLKLHEALDALSKQCDTTARIVEMRFFGGMTHAEITSVLGLSQRTIGNKWRFAKVWLYRAMSADQGEHESCQSRNSINCNTPLK